MIFFIYLNLTSTFKIHMMYRNDFYSKCQYVFKTRSRYGQTCGNINCKYHDKYNCNLAKYLKLPSIFFNVAKLIDKDDYFFYFTMFERSLTSRKDKEIIRMASLLFGSFQTTRNNRVKELIVICSYKFIDSHSVLLNNEKFKKAADEKLKELMLLSSNNAFINYMRCTFQSGKRFLSFQRNREYRKRVFRLYIKTLFLTNKWFNETIEKRYSPFGIGAIEAKESFMRSYSVYLLNK